MSISKMILRIFFWLFFVLISCSSTKNKQPNSHNRYWSDLNREEKSLILNSAQLNKEAFDFYEGNLILGDNIETKTMLDSLTDSHIENHLLPFYFYLFNRVCESADGELSEIIGRYCIKVVLNWPEYVIRYFEDNKDMLLVYSGFMGYEFYFKELGTSSLEISYKEFKQRLNNNLKNKEQFEKTLELFIREIEKAIENMD